MWLSSCVCVNSVMNWGPAQGVPRLSPDVSRLHVALIVKWLACFLFYDKTFFPVVKYFLTLWLTLTVNRHTPTVLPSLTWWTYLQTVSYLHMHQIQSIISINLELVSAHLKNIQYFVSFIFIISLHDLFEISGSLALSAVLCWSGKVHLGGGGHLFHIQVMWSLYWTGWTGEMRTFYPAFGTLQQTLTPAFCIYSKICRSHYICDKQISAYNIC